MIKLKGKKLILTLFVFIITIMLYAFMNKTYAVTSGIGKINVTDTRTTSVSVSNTTLTYEVKHRLFDTDPSNRMQIWKLISQDETQSNTNILKNLYCIRAGLGFANQTGAEVLHSQAVNYNRGYEMVLGRKEYKRNISR